MNYQPDLITAGLKMSLYLIFILGGLFLFSYFMRKGFGRKMIGAGDRRINVLESLNLGLKKSIMLIEIPGAWLVLGIAGDNISTLAKIEDKEMMQQQKKLQSNPQPLSFSEQLLKFSSKFKAGNK